MVIYLVIIYSRLDFIEVILQIAAAAAIDSIRSFTLFVGQEIAQGWSGYRWPIPVVVLYELNAG